MNVTERSRYILLFLRRLEGLRPDFWGPQDERMRASEGRFSALLLVSGRADFGAGRADFGAFFEVCSKIGRDLLHKLKKIQSSIAPFTLIYLNLPFLLLYKSLLSIGVMNFFKSL